MPAKNYASTRYSRLDQINSANVQRLQLASSFAIIAGDSVDPHGGKCVRATAGSLWHLRYPLAPGVAVVFGAGNADADLMFVGEAPGANDSIRFDSGNKKLQYLYAVTRARDEGIRPVLILEDGTRLTSSRGYRDRLPSVGDALPKLRFGFQ